MAIHREPEYCILCGRRLVALYMDQSNTPFMMRVIGDTFIGYKQCECIIVPTPSPVGIDVEALAEQKAKEKYPGEMNMVGYKINAQKNNQEKFIEGFKAGYAYKSNKSIIEWTDFLGEMGWYKVKETGRWEHDDEQGYFESAEDLVNHYLKGIIEPQSSTEEEEKLWDELIEDVDDGCLQSQLQEKYKISKR